MTVNFRERHKLRRDLAGSVMMKTMKTAQLLGREIHQYSYAGYNLKQIQQCYGTQVTLMGDHTWEG
jgi:hypothetical protein